VFFTNFGTAYTSRIVDLPATTGYGEPIQSLFKFKDNERVVGAVVSNVVAPTSGAGSRSAALHGLAASSDGYAVRFEFEPYLEVSTRAGRRFARVAKDAEIVGVLPVRGDETIIAATRQARAMLCKVEEVSMLGGPGRGVILIKLQKDDDRLLGFIASTGDRDLMVVETSRGAEQTISTAKYGVTGRGGKGRELLQRGQFIRVVPPDPQLPVGNGA
jgi:DNA gyrase subunit A